MPQLGESMAEATIVAIKVQPGDKVSADQEIIEVETDKAVMGVTTPCAGEIAKIDAEVKGTYAVGAVLGYVEASEADAARFQKRAPQPPTGDVASEVPGREEQSAKAVRTQNGSGSHFQVDEAGLPPVAAGSHIDQASGLPVPAGTKGAGYLSPRVRARMAELRLTQADLAGIAGTGNAGRVTIKDLENFLSGIEKHSTEEASAIRTGVADAMRRSWTRPLATVGVSVCLDPVLQDRAQRDPKPGPALYAVRALALALAENPAAAARLIGGRAIRSESIDIGVAVEAQDGIMVPVIRGAGQDITRRTDQSLHGTGGSGTQTPARPRADVGRHRVRFELRDVRTRLGNADSAAGPDALAWTRRREKGAIVERGETAIRAGHASRADPELRSSQSGWRWRGPVAQTHSRIAGRPGETLGTRTTLLAT